MRLTLTALLLAGCAVLAGLVARELRPDDADAVADLAAPRQPPPPASGTGQEPEQGAQWVETILARPLFTPGRRPAASSPVATAEAPAQALPRMTAILIDGPERRAIFAGENGARPLVVSEGGRIGAFKVQAIGPQQVTVLGPDGTRTVRTSFDPNPPPPPPVAAIPGPASPIAPGPRPAEFAR